MTQLPVNPNAYREDRPQGLPIPERGPRDHGPTLCLRRGQTDGDARAHEVQEIPGLTAPGVIRDSRTERLTGNPERAQSSHESYKLHGTNIDPWAISDHGVDKAKHWGETEGIRVQEGQQKRRPKSLNKKI